MSTVQLLNTFSIAVIKNCYRRNGILSSIINFMKKPRVLFRGWMVSQFFRFLHQILGSSSYKGVFILCPKIFFYCFPCTWIIPNGLKICLLWIVSQMWSRDWSSRSQVRDAALLSFIEVHAHPPKHLDHSKAIDLWFLESSTMRFRLRSLTSAFLTLFPSKYSVQYIKVYFKSSLSFYYAMENCAGAVLGQILSFFTLQLTYRSPCA